MNRIDQKFNELKSKSKKAFIAFITAGDPDLETTVALVPALEKAGADIIELGIPFSDPMAEGETIQAASSRAIAKGATVERIFKAVEKIRTKTQIPIAFMTYYNPVFSYGDEKFVDECSRVGVDGLIIPDLPPEEAGVLRKAASRKNISTIFFVAPTTTDVRIKANVQAATGFVYYVTLAGVTGVKQAVANDVVKNIARIKKCTDKPVCAGFGITGPQQVKEIAKVADGVIVGSAIVKTIAQHAGRKDLVDRVASYVKSLAQPLI